MQHSSPDGEEVALFKGEAVQMPLDLFIPPDALEIWIESYEGPLDLLLHLIRKNNYDILDIPIAEVANQYMEYIHYLERHRFELASEYLVMAAWLAEIKSRILLPRAPANDDEAEEEDPRLELIKKLQIYTLYKDAAEELQAMPRHEGDLSTPSPQLPHYDATIPLPEVSVDDLVGALKKLLKRASLTKSHTVTREKISVDERIDQILDYLSFEKPTQFSELFHPEEGRYGITISFLAILELSRQQRISLIQSEAFADIEIALTDNPTAETSPL